MRPATLAPQRPAPGNSLLERRPDLAAEWDAQANATLTPAQVSAGSDLTAWWTCPQGHPGYRSTVRNRNQGGGCPPCRSRRRTLPAPGRSLAELRPEVAALWDCTANGELTPQDVYSRSNRSAWWVCAAGHPSYLLPILQKGIRTSCPECSRLRPQMKIRKFRGASLAEARPDLVQAWDTAANGDLTPADVAPDSLNTVSWICPNGHGAYRMRVHSRVRKTSAECGNCSKSKPRRKNPGKTLAAANPALAAQWDTARNADLRPDAVNANSLEKAWWTCSAGHPSYYSRISNRHAGSGCPECGRQKATTGRAAPDPGQSLADLFPAVAATWDADTNAGVLAADVKAGSTRLRNWICPRGHGRYSASPYYAVHRGCPGCGRERRADTRSLPKPGRSLAELRPDLAAEWDTAANFPRTPEDVAVRSKRVYSWVCPEGHPAYRMRAEDRHYSHACPVCRPSSASRAARY